MTAQTALHTDTPATPRASAPWWLRLAAVFVGAIAIWNGIALFSGLIFGQGYSYASHTFSAVATSALVLVLLCVLLRWERRPAAAYGLLPDRLTPARAGIGALGYLIPFAVVGVTLLSIGAATITVSGSPVEVIGQLLAVLALVVLFEAIPEELIFRGYIFSILKDRMPVWLTVVGQSTLFCLFGIAIGAASTPDRLLLLALFSLSLGTIRAATGSVFATIGYHTAFQFVSQPLVSSQWTAFSLDDPERLFSDFAYGLGPFVIGPLLVILIVKLTRMPRPR